MINRSNHPVGVCLFLKKELNCWLITLWKDPFTICILPPLFLPVGLSVGQIMYSLL